MKALLACDLDGTLVGDPASLRRLLVRLGERRGALGLAYVTGRSAASARRLMALEGLPEPDVLIGDVGTAIYGRASSAPDAGWARVLAGAWDAEAVDAVARDVPALARQPELHQGPYKRSFEVAPSELKAAIERLAEGFARRRLSVHMVYSSGSHLDVLPLQGGKGTALRFACERLGLARARVLACGDSGNDLDMLRHGGPGAIVGNGEAALLEHAPPEVYRARAPFAAGVEEALEHFRWLGVLTG